MCIGIRIVQCDLTVSPLTDYPICYDDPMSQSLLMRIFNLVSSMPNMSIEIGFKLNLISQEI